VADGFVYSSETNDWWLGAHDLAGLLRFAPATAA
jgi:hypothetical protein